MTATCRLSFNKYQYSLGAVNYRYARVPKSGIPMFLEKKIAKKVIDAERSVFGLEIYLQDYKLQYLRGNS
jgi:hypothetical protein